MNAAHNTISTIPLYNRVGLSALEQLFSDQINFPKRAQTKIPDSFTTHPQAEVLVLEPIEQSFFIEIIFNALSNINSIEKLIN